VSELYGRIRDRAAGDPPGAHRDFIETRDRLFRTHPSTPLGESARRVFAGLSYAPYRPGWRVVGRVEHHVARDTLALDSGGDGTLTLVRVGRVAFLCPEGDGALDLFWVSGYGGGLFLPFGDATNGRSSYGGGRYLYDTIKGADLGAGETDMVLDFNFAYNPSCAYDDRWACPLAPPGNVLPFPIPAGERSPGRNA
jgi:uncharacterized protein (DUF1684 family)